MNFYDRKKTHFFQDVHEIAMNTADVMFRRKCFGPRGIKNHLIHIFGRFEFLKASNIFLSLRKE